MARLPSIVALALAVGAMSASLGCGAEGDATGSEQTEAAIIGRESQPTTVEPEEVVTPAACPPEAGPGCEAAEGRIVFVEAVDPDGDGDAHFVITDGGSITLPGLTAIDVRRGLRPEPLPGVGDLISAAGPVQTGSHGQSQIHALVLNVARPAR